jgi:hypothetical protein
VPACAEGKTDKSNCLTREEIEAAVRLYEGPKDSAGHQFALGGLIPASELNWPSATETPPSAQMALPMMQYVLLPATATDLKKRYPTPFPQRTRKWMGYCASI